MVVRRRNRPASRSHHSSSSSSSTSSLFKNLSSNTWIAKWFRKGKKDHSHRPPSALQLQHGKHQHEKESEKEGQSENWDQSVTAFKAIISARICSAVWSHISDCDETFNYWEPAHYLLYGSGMQTWEYSPDYAIRSYAFVWLYTLPGILMRLLSPTVRKTLIFVTTRILLALLCTGIEVYFQRGIHHAFGSFVAKITLAIQVFSIGMTIASISFLPSTFSMYCILLITGSSLLNHVRPCILANVVNSLLGWPFATLAALPFVIHTAVVNRHDYKFMLKYSAFFVLLIAVRIYFDSPFLWSTDSEFPCLFKQVPMISIDSYFYGKLVIAPFNIVMYNVFGSKGGPELYGTEPWYFYVLNLILNFNLILIAALSAIPLFVSTLPA